MFAGCQSSGNGQSAVSQASPQQGVAGAKRDISAHTEDAASHTPNPDHNDGDHCFQQEKPGVNRDLVLTVTAPEISANNVPTAFLINLDPNNRQIVPEQGIENVSDGSAQIRIHDPGTDRKKQHLGPGPYVAVASTDTTMLSQNRGGAKKQPAVLTFPYVTFNDPSECPVLNLRTK